MTESIRLQLNTFINSFLNNIEKQQEMYLQKFGIYWQGIKIPNIIPSFGKTEIVDLSRNTTYQTKNWQDMNFSLPDKIPFQIEIHQHWNTKRETGFQIFFRIKYLNELYVKVIGYKLAQSFSSDWSKVIKENYG